MGVTFPAARRTISQAVQRHWTAATSKLLMRLYGEGLRHAVGSQLIILANPAEAEVIQGWRAGEVSRQRAKGPVRLRASLKCPAVLTNENVVGAIPPPDFHGLKVLGAYGKAWLIETNYVPAGYVAVVASGGPGVPTTRSRCGSTQTSPIRACGLSQGIGADYPLIDSFFARGVGVGVRHRGAAAVVQVTTNASTPRRPRP